MSPIPNPFERKRPPAPTMESAPPIVDAKLREALEGISTPQEIQYTIEVLKQKIGARVKQQASQQGQGSAPVQVIDPATQGWIEDLKTFESIHTSGYLPLEQLMAQKQGAGGGEPDLTLLKQLWDGLNTYFPSLREKIEEVGVQLLDLLSKKMEEK